MDRRNDGLKIKLLELELTQIDRAVNVIDDIMQAVEKLDKKSPAKLGVALKKIDKDLRAIVNSNSLQITLYKTPRCISAGNGAVEYLSDSYVTIFHMALRTSYGDQALNDDGTLHAGAIVAALEESKPNLQGYGGKIRYAIDHYKELLDDVERAHRDYEEARDNIPYIMQQYFGVKGFRI